MRIADCGLWIDSFQLRIADCGLWIDSFQFRIVDCGLFRLWIWDYSELPRGVNRVERGETCSNMNAEEFKNRTKTLALRVIHLCEELPKSRASDVISKQLLR